MKTVDRPVVFGSLFRGCRILASSAFTLIELLIVLAIIAILMSLVLPALSRAKASAYSVKCKSNLHQIGLGLRMYLDDQGHFPQVSGTLDYGTPGSEETWALSVNKYLNQPVARFSDLSLVERQAAPNLYPHPLGIFICPSDKRKRYGMGGGYGYNSVGIGLRLGHEGLGLGGQGVPRPTNAFYPQPTRESDLRVPSRMIAIGDAYRGSYHHSPEWPEFDVYESRGEFTREGIAHAGQSTSRKRHRGRLNVLFSDGHVEGIKIETLFFSRDENDMRMWNFDHEPHRQRLFASPGAPGR